MSIPSFRKPARTRVPAGSSASGAIILTLLSWLFSAEASNLCAASAMFLPTPPREKRTLPLLVEAGFRVVERLTMSRAAQPKRRRSGASTEFAALVGRLVDW